MPDTSPTSRSPVAPEGLAARIDALWVYPIKACAAVEMDEIQIDSHGLIAGDREWVVVDEHGHVTWQGVHPTLSQVQPAWIDGQWWAGLRGTEARALDPQGRDGIVHLWNDRAKAMEVFPATDAGDGVAELLLRATGAPLRLARLGQEGRNRSGVNPLHLVHAASIDELNQHLLARGLPCAEVLRFRPNLLISGVDASCLPFIEDHAAALRSAGWRMPITTPCERCVVPGIHPVTGEQSPELTAVVAELSAGRRPGVPSCFGVYGAPTPGSRLRRGEHVWIELAF
ncbi:MOSC N-terminal beta barrel domain-containing protein [Ideonella sp. DXS29W]|uniref:MOSC N-terminal beta barrel domain-containing protein n=1 Tax=Ideonella lacteola TaxID=2984193 RepID=A0ABU9C176_9BURK